jgi:hypothetical protein
MRAVCAKQFGDLGTDATAGTGDDGDLAVEVASWRKVGISEA